MRELQLDLKSYMSPPQFRAALKELQEDLYLMVVLDSTILSNETPRYIDAGVCRYKH